MATKEKFEEAKRLYETANADQRYVLESLFPKLKESEDERIKKELIEFVKSRGGFKQEYIAWIEEQAEHKKFRDSIQVGDKVTKNEDGVLVNLSQLKRVAKKDEKQGGQNPAMIQWKGNNLKEVIDFTGVYKDGFEKWFHNSWEEYEKYVHEHNNIFKIFNKDGSHIEVPVGAWIVKTPDGYNTASRYVFRQKPAGKVEPKFKIGDFIVNDYCMGRIVEITNDAYLLDTEQGIPFSCHSTRLWDVTKDANDGDVLATDDWVFIFEKLNTNGKSICYCHYDVELGFVIDVNTYISTGSYIRPATEEQRDTLEKAMTDAGYTFDFEKRELKKIEQPKQKWSDEDENELAILRGYIKSGEWSTAHISRALGIIDSIINKMTEK